MRRKHIASACCKCNEISVHLEKNYTKMSSMTVYIVPACDFKCPVAEIQFRLKNKLIHPLELDADGDFNKHLMVKEYTRSAAGTEVPTARDIRTPPALCRTVYYLLRIVMMKPNQPFVKCYDFIHDRLRAVRKDMIVQDCPKGYCLFILHPSARFYTYAAYRLCTQPISKFDPDMNNEHLQECLKRILIVYDEWERTLRRRHTVDCGPCDSIVGYRPFFEALYVINNLGDPDALERGIRVRPVCKCCNLNSAVALSLNYRNNNYVNCFKLIPHLSGLLCAAACMKLPLIRRKAFQTMRAAYSSKNVTVPLDYLTQLCLYDYECNIVRDLTYCGIEVKDKKVLFYTNPVQGKKSCLPPTHTNFAEQKLFAYPLDQLITSV